MQQPEPPVDSPEHTDVSMPERRHGLAVRMMGWLLSWLLRIQSATWRVDVEDMGQLQNAIARADKVLVVFWHGKFIPLFPLLAGYSLCVFTSVSLRGDIIAEICRRFGFDAVQIPDHGGNRSLDLMRRALFERRAGAIAVDGPLGPRHDIHRGAIRLASELGFVLLPVSVAAVRKHVREKRWDRIELPALLTRLYVITGEPLTVPSHLTEQDISHWKVRLRAALTALDQRAEQKAAALRATRR